jgi:hypothetical protein
MTAAEVCPCSPAYQLGPVADERWVRIVAASKNHHDEIKKSIKVHPAAVEAWVKDR